MVKDTVKTYPTDNNVKDFIASLVDVQQQKDSLMLVEIMEEVTGLSPVMWGTSIIGFGTYHYKYASGREADWLKIGFSPRKGKMSLYITGNADKYSKELDAMGKYKIGKGCIYFNKLSDIDSAKLKSIIRTAYKDDTYF